MHYLWAIVSVGIAFVLGFKCLPLGWHMRLFYTQWLHSKSKQQHAPGKVFATITSSSRTPMLELDLNLHKSNSTFFSDMDISRAALIFELLSPGIRDGELAAELMGRKALILAGVYCSFRKEIVPFAAYEMASQIVSWDSKWIYIATYFMQPGGGTGKKRTVYASGLSRYVFKKGRVTVAPERLLRAAGLLAEKEGGMEQGVGTGEEWTWARVEDERKRGLRFAENLSSLDIIHDW